MQAEAEDCLARPQRIRRRHQNTNYFLPFSIRKETMSEKMLQSLTEVLTLQAQNFDEHSYAVRPITHRQANFNAGVQRRTITVIQRVV